jgi:hypothetical protein
MTNVFFAHVISFVVFLSECSRLLLLNLIALDRPMSVSTEAANPVAKTPSAVSSMDADELQLVQSLRRALVAILLRCIALTGNVLSDINWNGCGYPCSIAWD